MIERTTAHWPIALGGVIVLLMGSWTMYIEAAPTLRGGDSAISRLSAMPSGEAPIGLTVLSQHGALLDCEELFRSARAIELQYLSAGQRGKLVSVCGEMAEVTLVKNPTDAFAWLVSAAASAARGDHSGLNAALRNSQLSGANEGWLANMRIEVGEANLTSLSEETLAGHERDMRIAASTPSYAAAWARRYLVDEGFRMRMIKVLGAMRPEDQRRFLSAVRAALTNSGR